MTLPRRSSVLAHAFVIGVLACLSMPLIAESPKTPPIVDPAVLEPLLPAPDGWKVARHRSDRILKPDCTYSFAEVVLTKDEMSVRLTVADTGGNEGSLMALASMIVTLPEDFVGDVPPSTTIRRMVIDGNQASERFSVSDRDGEFALLVDKRFVVVAEGTKIDAIDPVRLLVQAVDLKKLAALK